jgi:hypothetical protein
MRVGAPRLVIVGESNHQFQAVYTFSLSVMQVRAFVMKPTVYIATGLHYCSQGLMFDMQDIHTLRTVSTLVS